MGYWCLPTYDCDYSNNIYEGLTHCAGIVGYGLAEVMYNTRLGATALTVVVRTGVSFWYHGACLMIVTVFILVMKAG